jgi:peptide/nickel transport system substrate-binding protein
MGWQQGVDRIVNVLGPSRGRITSSAVRVTRRAPKGAHVTSFRSRAAVFLVLLLLLAATGASAAPEGQMTWAVHVSLAPAWFDPAETPSVLVPFMVLYALHDALVKPMPGHPMAPSLAESWTASRDGLSYEFILRKGIKFHNGDPVTAEDVKFSFERYKGGGAAALKARVAAVEVVDAQRVRFPLKQP